MRRGLMLGENGDLLVRDGSLVVGDTDYQNIGLILGASPGEVKGTPALGPGLERYLKGCDNGERIKRAAVVHLEADGYVTESVKMVDNRLIIDVK